jgi:hypothetical protein
MHAAPAARPSRRERESGRIGEPEKKQVAKNGEIATLQNERRKLRIAVEA